jgi:hypothetical protein
MRKSLRQKSRYRYYKKSRVRVCSVLGVVLKYVYYIYSFSREPPYHEGGEVNGSEYIPMSKRILNDILNIIGFRGSNVQGVTSDSFPIRIRGSNGDGVIRCH